MKEKLRLLIAEDDPNLGIILSEYLSAKGFDVTLCRNGQEAFDSFMKKPHDFCILDVMMPLKDGFTLAKEIRKVNVNIPIIFLTAKALKEDTVEGFRIGADDYVTKPFSMEELMARINAIWKRVSKGELRGSEQVFTVGKYTFDHMKQILTFQGKEQHLTTRESELLKLLCQMKNEVLERTYALKAVWEDDSYFNSRSMDVYIAKLRKYLKEDEDVEIQNVHGKGFRLLAP